MTNPLPVGDNEDTCRLALDTIERAWGALGPFERGRSTLATVIAAQLATRDEEIARLRAEVECVANDAIRAVARQAQLEAALRECEVDAISRPDTCPVGRCDKCGTTEWLNGDLCHATTCVFGALTKELGQ